MGEETGIEEEEAKALDPEAPPGDIGEELRQRYLAQGRELLSDSLPTHLDPRIVRRLEPLLGDVSDVRVHTGKAATAAARAMEARAFAVGDQDIFIDEAEYHPGTEKGDTLLAHEVAHTVDASTGFGLSSERHGGEEEAFAREVEMAFAQEDAVPEAEPEVTEASPASGAQTEVSEGEPNVDVQALESRIMAIMEEQEKRDRDRHGH